MGDVADAGWSAALAPGASGIPQLIAVGPAISIAVLHAKLACPGLASFEEIRAKFVRAAAACHTEVTNSLPEVLLEAGVVYPFSIRNQALKIWVTVGHRGQKQQEQSGKWHV